MTADAALPPEIWGAILDAASEARIGVAVSYIDDEGPVETIWVSDAAVEIIGWPRETLLGRKARDIVAPEAQPSFDERSRRRERTYETVFVQQTGRRIPVEVSVADTNIGARRTAVVFVRDVSARRGADAALAASEGRFRRLVESAPDGVAISREGVLVYVNAAAVRLLGYESPAELVGRSMATILVSEDFALMITRIRAAQTSSERLAPQEYRAIRRDGALVVAEITSHPIDYEGAPAVLAFARDVTDRARMREQLERAERLTALGTLAAGVAHEINNPLAYVTLGLQRFERLLAQRPDTADLRSDVVQLRAGVDRVAEIVRDLRTFSRGDNVEGDTADLATVIETAERLTSHETRLRAAIRVRVEGRLTVRGSRGRLEQVMMNLLVNAAHAIPEERTDGTIDVRAHAADDRVIVTVRDDGAGIAPEIVSRVFDPFFTTKPAGEGTGLGLAICHSIVMRLGGEISIESFVGRGTTVTLSLVRGEAHALPPASARTSLTLAGLDILVVDDEPALARSIARLLSTHRVTVATSGEQALAHLRAGVACDLVVCDVRMPGLSGPDVYERAVAERPDVARRFLFMTGGALTPRSAQVLGALEAACLDKPFTAEALEQAIHRITRTR